jgi:hypothetical protein
MDKAAELKHSKPLKDSLWSDFEEVDNLVSVVLKEIKSALKVERFNKTKYKSNLKVLLLNLLVTYSVSPKMYLAVARGFGDYSTSRYNSNNIGYKVFVRLVDILSELGYIEYHRGYFVTATSAGKRSRIRANTKLIKHFKSSAITTAMITMNKNEETIILKKSKEASLNPKKKDLVYYIDTDETNKMRGNLERINTLLDRTWIDIEISDKELIKLNQAMDRETDKNPIDFTRRKLRRIFNNSSFEQGGRFYHGWWQEISSSYRKYITISGKLTEEEDFSGIHIRMMYALEGIEYGSEDTYIIEGYGIKYREEVKKALNTIINAKTREEAVYSINDKLTLPKNRTAEDLFNKLKLKHPKIAKYFATGIGIELQYLDSQIAEKVMIRLSKDNIVALPIHDSFIVRVSHLNDLKQEMIRAYKEVLTTEAIIDKKESIRKELEQQEQQRPLVKDQINYKGLREPISGDELINITQEGIKNYKQYNRREREWSASRGYP